MKYVVAFLVSVLAGIVWAGDIPDLQITPGAVRTGLTKKKICEIKWGRDERHVTVKMKRQVFDLYGYSGYDDPRCVPAGKRRCEIDHLISRELGGADEVKNLWPQAYGTSPWNAVLKDKLENRLNREMCAGNISLREARDMLVNDWRKAYVKYYGEP
ncbi:MAG TPA: hypothetical protein VF780_01550 [Nitrosospira sp.]